MIDEGATVYCVICIDDEGGEHVHIFSTPDRRRAFMEADDRRLIAYDYLKAR